MINTYLTNNGLTLSTFMGPSVQEFPLKLRPMPSLANNASKDIGDPMKFDL